MTVGSRRNLRWARRAMILGALLLAAAVALVIWDAAGDDPPPPVITGDTATIG